MGIRKLCQSNNQSDSINLISHSMIIKSFLNQTMLHNYFFTSGFPIALLLTIYPSSVLLENKVLSPSTHPQATAPRDNSARKAALQQALVRYLKAEKVPPNVKQHFFSSYIDLNGDGVQDAVAILAGQYWCGTGGCTMLVFKGQATAFSLVSRSTLIRPPITASETKTNGWRDLIVEVRGGGATPKKVALKFDGKKYPLNPSLQPSIPTTTSIKGTVLFPEGTQPQRLPNTPT